ncbi:condensation domain-containing protein [Chitinophaga sp. MD30]|uniref:condensation domain-containing protein n=1 Tax=Chitinophaga sp. MD30 TaxID=2033437 RepID=UPI000BB06B2A|nr:condensation domain-containing protein [Chitinophaga sp. MD30]ASZ13668.1 hypothetical protein CK934_23290 [Chitinophaga sp. MD30]
MEVKSESEQQRISSQRDFWLAQYSDLPDPLELPLDFNRPLIKNTDGAVFKDKLSKEVTIALKELAAEEGLSMFMLLLSVYHILLNKLSNQEDIVIGTPTAGRLHADLKEVMGMFVNTLPLRNRSEHTSSFRSFLQQVKKNTLSSFDNQEYQYEDILESLGVNRDTSRNPLFDVMLSYEDFETNTLTLDGVDLNYYDDKRPISKFDLTLFSGEHEEQIIIDFEYNTTLFRSETIDRLATYFKRIVSAVVADTNVLLKDIVILDEVERDRLLTDNNDTTIAYPANETFIDLFSEQVHRTPDALALRQGLCCMAAERIRTATNIIAA